MERPISTRLHGVIDYTTSAALVAAPELFGLKGVRASALAPRIAGAGAAAYSALTDYEHGVARRIPMRAHLALDAAGGAALAASPWALGYARHGTRHWLPHALVGTGEIVAALATKTEPPLRERMRGGRIKLGAVALVALGAAALVANRERLRGLRRTNEETPPPAETMYASVGVASAGATGVATDDDAPGGEEPAPSESPGTTAPPL